MRAGDSFTNNTEYDLFVHVFDGEEITLSPGDVFEASRDMTITFDANTSYTFRAYLNSGYRRN